MREWQSGHPVVIVEGDGALLRDSNGREYIDGNSSIWTNLHGHRCAAIDDAIRDQLGKIAHSSFLGLTNEIAPRLAERLLRWINGGPRAEPGGWKVFFSDDGSTAVEAGLKMIHQARQQRGEPERRVYLSLAAGYHGDTVGAMSLGHSRLFHSAYRSLLFETRETMTPFCYRCPHNRAKPVRGSDARDSRQCNWECVGEVETALDDLGTAASAFVIEPLVQGAGSMAMHPSGYLRRVADLFKGSGVWLFLDEVFTGFGRTGPMFAFQKEEVRPDLVALAKGFTGGYLPLAATVATQEIFEAFLGDYAEYKTFFHGHSYSGNPLGCAAANASLAIFEGEDTLASAAANGSCLGELIQRFWGHPNVGDVRREGTICAIELVADFATRARFDAAARIGFRVCEASRDFGLITRPIGDVLLLMPPYCTTRKQLEQAVDALWRALNVVLPFA